MLDRTLSELARDIGPLVMQESNSYVAAQTMAARNDDPLAASGLDQVILYCRNHLETIVLLRSLLLALAPHEAQIRALLGESGHDTQDRAEHRG